MEIKNFNIYNGHNSNTSAEIPKKKKLHKKTISALNSPAHNNHLNPNPLNHKNSQKENIKYEKRAKHHKAKSQ